MPAGGERLMLKPLDQAMLVTPRHTLNVNATCDGIHGNAFMHVVTVTNLTQVGYKMDRINLQNRIYIIFNPTHLGTIGSS